MAGALRKAALVGGLGLLGGAAAEATMRLAWGTHPLLAWYHPLAPHKLAQVKRLRGSDRRLGTVFVGSSVVLEGVDPRIAAPSRPGGPPSYNAALNGLVLPLQGHWTHLLGTLMTPDEWVIGWSTLDFNEHGTYPAGVVDAYRSARAYPGAGRISDVALVRHAGDLLTRDLLVPRAIHRRLAHREREKPIGVDPRGAGTDRRDRQYVLHPKFVRAMRDEWLADYEVTAARRDLAERLLRDLAAEGTPVTVVFMPSSEDLVGLHPRGHRDVAAARAAAERAAEAAGVDVLVPPSSLLGRDHFADPIHLNGRGMRALSGWLAGSGRSARGDRAPRWTAS